MFTLNMSGFTLYAFSIGMGSVRFFVLDSAETQVHEGVGVGLDMTKELQYAVDASRPN